MEEQICLWIDAAGEVRVTRCTIDVSTGMPVGFPGGEATSMVIIEFEKGYEPMFYHEALITEMSVENTFP